MIEIDPLVPAIHELAEKLVMTLETWIEEQRDPSGIHPQTMTRALILALGWALFEVRPLITRDHFDYLVERAIDDVKARAAGVTATVKPALD